MNDLLDVAAGQLRRNLGDGFDFAVVLGSGWANAHFGDTVAEVSYDMVAGFLPPVHGHSSSIRKVVTPEGRMILVVPRHHLYQGATPDEVAFPVRVSAALGCDTIVLTNAAGSTRTKYVPGDILAITDHINFTGVSPANGFVDMSNAYPLHLRQLAHDVDWSVGDGVYMQFHGPQYETPAEVALARTLGADLVGMSTALETIAAVEEHMDVLGLSLVTNMAAGMPNSTLDHEDVLAVGTVVQKRLGTLLQSIFDSI